MALVYLMAGMILFGSATPVSRLIGQEVSTFTASATRVLLGALVLLPVAWGRLGGVRAIRARQWLDLVLITAFGMVGFTALLVEGMARIPGVAGSVVMALVPVVTALGARFFFGSSFNRTKIAAIVLATLGVAALQVFRGSFMEGSTQDFLVGVALVFGAVCCEAAYTLVGKRATEDLDPVLVTFLATLLAVPVFVLLSVATASPIDEIAAIDARTSLAILWWGAGTLALGSVFWYRGVARAEAGSAPAFMGLMPVSALVLSYALLGESFRWPHLVGFGLVFAAVLLMSREHRRHARS